MIDTPATPSAALQDDIPARNKEILFAALAAAGIYRVTVEYDGSGDSGQIEDVAAWNAANERLPFPTDPRITLVPENPHHPHAEHNLEAAIESVAWHYLYDLYCGWENNDGACGTFVFDISARTLTLEHNERYTDVNTATREL